MDGQKKNTWWRRPAGWVCAFAGMLGIQAAAYLLCELGAWVVAFLDGLSTVAVVLLVLLFGSVFLGLFLYSVALLPTMVVSWSNRVSKSRRGTRYNVIGIYTLVGCAILIYAGIRGAVRGGSMLWFYVRFGYIALASVLMMATGREQAEPKEQAKDKPKTNKALIFLLVLLAVLCLCVAWKAGRQFGAENTRAELAEQMDAAVKQAALDAKSEGKHEQLSRDKKSMEYNGTTAAKIARRIKAIYGMPPQDAYEIVAAYNENGNHGGYSWDEYQEALEAVLRTASMFDGK